MRFKLFVVLLGIAGAAMAQPRFVADNEIQKMGELVFKQPRRVVFGFTNKGDSPLVISNVVPSCGCTKVEYSKNPILAGKRGEIVALYDAGILGSFTKFLEVYTNVDPNPVMLTMQGRVVASASGDVSAEFPFDLGNVLMSTNYIEFDNVNKGDYPVAEFRIMNKERAAFRPQLMHLPSYITAEYLPENIPGGRTGKVRLTLDSEKVPSYGLNQTSIYLARYMGDKVSETNEMMVSAVLLPAFSQLTADELEQAPVMMLSETELSVGPFGRKKELSYTVKVSNLGKRPLEIKNIQVFNQAVGVSLSNRTIQPGAEAKLKIYVNAERLKKAKARPRVLLVTNDPRHAIERINIKLNQD